jgi:hypothetical protein
MEADVITAWNATLLRPCRWCGGPLPRGAEEVITWRLTAARQDHAMVCRACYARWLADGVIRAPVAETE